MATVQCSNFSFSCKVRPKLFSFPALTPVMEYFSVDRLLDIILLPSLTNYNVPTLHTGYWARAGCQLWPLDIHLPFLRS